MRKSEKVRNALNHPFYRLGGVALLAFIIYGGTLDQPFVQDDWRLIHFFTFAETHMQVIREFLKGGSFFYRPIPMLYHYAVYVIAGPHPEFFHGLLLVWVITTAFVALRASERFGFGKRTSTLISILWLGSAYLLKDTQLWIVGMNEPACLIFCLLSLSAWWQKKPIRSALWLAPALFTKESAVYVPLTLGLYAGWSFVIERDFTWTRAWAWGRSLLPQVLMCVAYLLVRLNLHQIQIPTENHPYAVTFLLTEQTTAWVAYLSWFIQNLFPGIPTELIHERATLLLNVPPLALWVPFILLTLLALLGLRWLDLKNPHIGASPCSRNRNTLFLIWALAAMAPFVMIADHPYRYYLIHAWVPMLMLTASLVGAGIRRFHLPANVLWPAVTLFTLIMVLGNTHRLHHQLTAGHDAPYSRGVNGLITKGSESRIVMRDLPILVPNPTPDHALVFRNTLMMGVLVHHGPEVMFGRGNFMIYREPEVRKEGNSWVATQGAQERRFSADKISFFEIRNGALHRVSPPEAK